MERSTDMSEQEQAAGDDGGRLDQSDDIQIVKELNDAYKEMTDQLGNVIVGQTHVIEQVLISMFCRGHVLLVGVPVWLRHCSLARLRKHSAWASVVSSLPPT